MPVTLDDIKNFKESKLIQSENLDNSSLSSSDLPTVNGITLDNIKKVRVNRTKISGGLDPVDDLGASTSSKLFGKIVNFEAGIGQSVLGAGLGIGELVRSGLQKVIPKDTGLRTSLGLDLPKASESLSVKKYTQPTTSVQSIGKLSGDILQFFAPVGAINKTVSAFQKFNKLSKFKNSLNFTAKSVIEGLAGGTVSAAQIGEINENVVNTAVVSALFPTIGLIGKGILSSSKIVAERIQNIVLKPDFKSVLEQGYKTSDVFDLGVAGNPQDVLSKSSKKIKDLQNKSYEILGEQAPVFNTQKYFGKVLDYLNKDSDRIKYAPEIDKMINFFNKYIKNINTVLGGSRKITIKQMDNLRVGFSEDAIFNHGIKAPDSNAKEKIATAFYRVAKDIVEESLPQGELLGQVRKEISKLIPIKNVAQRRLVVDNRNRLFGLGDVMLTIGGFGVGALDNQPSIFNPSFIFALGANRLAKSGKFSNFLNNVNKQFDDPNKVVKLINKSAELTAAGIKYGVSSEENDGI